MGSSYLGHRGRGWQHVSLRQHRGQMIQLSVFPDVRLWSEPCTQCRTFFSSFSFSSVFSSEGLSVSHPSLSAAPLPLLSSRRPSGLARGGQAEINQHLLLPFCFPSPGQGMASRPQEATSSAAPTGLEICLCGESGYASLYELHLVATEAQFLWAVCHRQSKRRHPLFAIRQLDCHSVSAIQYNK